MFSKSSVRIDYSPSIACFEPDRGVQARAVSGGISSWRSGSPLLVGTGWQGSGRRIRNLLLEPLMGRCPIKVSNRGPQHSRELWANVTSYNRARPYQGLQQQIPDPANALPPADARNWPIIALLVLGG